MKLRNKKTGEIREVKNILVDGMFTVNSLAELIDVWEDYEEPKGHWFITGCGDVMFDNDDNYDISKQHKIIGNYFETSEEAEKAVEKLKAWKRLIDKGFDFEYVEEYKNLCGNGFEIPIIATMPPEAYTDVEVSKDLDLLFGGE